MLLLLLSYLWLAAIVPAADTAQPDSGIVVLPVEVLGENGTTAERTLRLSSEQSERARAVWLQVHGVRYPEQASVQVNHGAWIPLRNDTVIVGEPGKSFGGIGGGFATLELAVPLPAGAVAAGANVIRFRFNRSDGLASGYRVLALNFVAGDGSRILPAGGFAEDAPESWRPPLQDEASIRAGRELWLNAPLVAGGRQDSPRIQARCADCHARDGRDLKYFNFSNPSIITRSRFHGLTTEQGEQIATYIRSLSVPNPGRPWNPPYQPGPGIDQRPPSDWAAGSGLSWALDSDAKGLPHLLDAGGRLPGATASQPAGQAPGPAALVAQIRPEVFHPDGNLNPREIPIAMQLPDWSQWLPRIHPKDAWGPAFAASEFAAMYDGGSREGRNGRQASLRSLLETSRTSEAGIRSVGAAFSRWQQARRAFLGGYVKTDTAWSSDLADKVYSTQLWQLTKAWEMTQEFELEGRSPPLAGPPER